MCFTVDPVATCDRSNMCCKTNFFKLELDVRAVCNRAIKSATLNGKPLGVPVFNFYGASNSESLNARVWGAVQAWHEQGGCVGRWPCLRSQHGT